jgi:hypothetical protein
LMRNVDVVVRRCGHFISWWSLLSIALRADT